MLNSGRVALVTGGSSGIGEAFAEHFVKTGGSVALIGRSIEKLQNASNSIATHCGLTENKTDRIRYYQADVRDSERAEEIWDEVFSDFGKVDVLINNAAGNFICKAEELSANGWNAVVQIVLNGTFFYSTAFARRLIARQQPGAIVNVVATYYANGGPGVCHSAAAKAGVVAFSKSVAVEWAKHRIRVNCIAPGPIGDTGGADRLWPTEEAYQRVLHSIPTGRLGSKEEIAKAMDWLASEQASFITGDVLTMDGGQSLGPIRF